MKKMAQGRTDAALRHFSVFYGRRIVRLSTRDITESAKRSINGRVYPPVEDINVLDRVATKEAHIRLKFITPRFAAKCFVP